MSIEELKNELLILENKILNEHDGLRVDFLMAKKYKLEKEIRKCQKLN
jgi:hypothetical protein